MPKTDVRPPCSWLTGLILIMVLAMASQVWGQPSGMGKGGGTGGLMGGGGMGGPMDGEGGPGPGGGRGRKAPLRFDLTKATTITGQVESLGSYGTSSWRSLPGMAVQGLILKTEHGNIEVYLGPPSYVTKQKFTLQKGDTLKVKGFKVIRKDQAAFSRPKLRRITRRSVCWTRTVPRSGSNRMPVGPILINRAAAVMIPARWGAG